MELIKSSYNIVSTVFFVAVILLAHIFSTNNYDWTRNTISDLGSQGYNRKAIMQFGFLAFGVVLTVGILLKGLTWRTTPILIYGLCVGLTGIFCEKPFNQAVAFSVTQATLHSALAQTAGIIFTIGILVQLFFVSNNNEKFIHLTFCILVIGLSLLFGLVKNYQGLYQRLLYLVSFIWLIKFYKP